MELFVKNWYFAFLKLVMQQLSTLNIFLAIVYVLLYLKSGTFNSTSGIFMIIVFNWLALRGFQLNTYRWRVWHYLIAAWVLYFIGRLVYGGISILDSSITYGFMSSDTLTYLLVNFLFCMLVLVQLIKYAYENYKELKLN
ncbi:MAG: hypothetical protein ACQUHE_03740 [Bacteroidia bacterium]